MSGTGGKVALVNSTTGLGCNGGSTPCTPAQLALIIDLVGWDGANFFETAPAPTTTNATAILRNNNGCMETDNNAADFSVLAPAPRNTASPINLCTAADTAPAVTSTYPVNGATDFSVNANLTVTFSEAVNVSAEWFTLSCSTSGPVSAAVSGGPSAFTLDPAVTLVHGETCTLKILAANVTDQDANDPPDTMEADFTIGFTPFNVCDTTFTPIYQIQGSGMSAAITGTVITRGVVVGDFEGSGSASGFYLQDPTGDGDPATSDGIFVYTGSTNLVSAGEVVRVTGYARERFNQTTLNGSDSNSSAVLAANVVKCGTGSVTPVEVNLPFADASTPERYEGMLVKFPQALTIAEYFNYDRYGEIVLALPLDGETRAYTGTAVETPGDEANARALANSLRRITLDDANSAQNPAVLRHPNGDPFSLTNLFRGGDLVTNAVGVLGYDFSLYRIVPTGPAEYSPVNPRPGEPEDVGGSLKIAAMNTLNYFLTADYPTGNPLDNKCGPLQNVECRGWDSDQALELTRQRTKLLQALKGLNAAVIGLNEVENTPGVEPLADLAAGLNDLLGAGTYAYIDTGVIGTDAIRVGLLYKPALVTPVGAFKVLTTAIDPRFLDTKNRPTLAQTFEEISTGARFTVAVNHLKSKGSDCNDIGDPDIFDGQGNCNLTRTAAAQAIVDWLATDPTGSGDPDFIIMGDLNSYAMEDPITAIKVGPDDLAGTADDYTNLIFKFQGKYAYSYVFDGQIGYLDHALSNASLTPQVTGVADWHINADESDVLDYDTSFKPPAQDALYETNQFRTSDHDAVIVGLNLNVAPQVGPISVSANPVAINTPLVATANFTDKNSADTHTAFWEWGVGAPTAGDITESGGVGQVSGSHAYAIPGIYTVKVTVTDNLGLQDQSTYENLVVYDPNGGFVTAGGWIRSNAGYYLPDATITGKANFGFVVKYLQNDIVPTGNVEFQLSEAKLNFKGTGFDWLVVNGGKATFMGSGTINGAGTYKFVISILDSKPDKFQIKIWDSTSGAVIYDNGALQELGGGSIQIQK